MVTPLARRVALSAMALALLGLAACSSDGRDESTTTTTGEVAAATATDRTAPRSVGRPLERYADYVSKDYDGSSHWLCRPDTDDDPCDGNLDTTRIDPDGTRTIERFERADDPPIDCFYVYPTFSSDPTQFSDWDANEEGVVTVDQAALLQSQCRLFVPVYRQLTNAGLAALRGGPQPPHGDGGDPYGDVLDAFRTYMANDNDGRGFVLIGHSQGTAMLNLLISKEIDPNADVRDRMVGAYLAGGVVDVPEGETTGGTFPHVPICTKRGEVGCAVTWGSYRSTAPPSTPKVVPGQPVRACVNPAAIGRDASAPLDARFPRGGAWTDPPGTKITTTFVALPGLLTGRCVANGANSYLAVTVHPSPGARVDDIPGDTPGNGLHLVDVTVAMNDIVDDVAAQASTFIHG